MIKKEFIIDTEKADASAMWGPLNKNLKVLQKAFSKLKLLARGQTVMATGEADEIDRFEIVLRGLETFISKYGIISDAQLSGLIERSQVSIQPTSKEDTEETESAERNESDVILHGNGGKIIRAKTPNQRQMVKSLLQNDILFAIGPAGTGKTYTAVALAVKALKNKEIKRIILARPAVEAGENLGFCRVI